VLLCSSSAPCGKFSKLSPHNFLKKVVYIISKIDYTENIKTEIVMNYYTREIAKLLEISLEDALRIQDEMECNGFDFSEATQNQFMREIKYQRQALSI